MMGNKEPHMGTVRRNVVLPDALDKELDAVAEMLKETKSNLITRALAYYLDLLDLSVAKERAMRHESSKENLRPSSEIKAKLGL